MLTRYTNRWPTYEAYRRLPGMAGVYGFMTPEYGLLISMQTSLIGDLAVFNWLDWLHDLKWSTAVNQDFLCICGQSLTDNVVDLHHALISKQDVRGVKAETMKRILHNSVNVVATHANCHSQLTRERCLKFLVALWGRSPIDFWYEQAVPNFKVPLRQLPY